MNEERDSKADSVLEVAADRREAQINLDHKFPKMRDNSSDPPKSGSDRVGELQKLSQKGNKDKLFNERRKKEKNKNVVSTRND